MFSTEDIITTTKHVGYLLGHWHVSHATRMVLPSLNRNVGVNAQSDADSLYGP